MKLGFGVQSVFRAELMGPEVHQTLQSLLQRDGLHDLNGVLEALVLYLE